MGLLDDDDFTEIRFTPKTTGRKFVKQTVLSQEERDSELNNEGREELTEDFSDSKFADR